MPKFLKWLLIVVVSGVALFFGLRWLVGRVSPTPEDLGVVDGRFAPCPSSPNCVSTYETDVEHGMDALVYDGETAVAQTRLLDIIQSMPRSAVISSDPGYLHAEFRTSVWRFVDDVEFYFDEEAGSIQFRSASRLGYEDMDANRKRMETIRAAYAGVGAGN